MDIFPGLPRTQRNAIVARAYKRFGDMPVENREVEFKHILEGNLHILTFRFTNGFVPSNPLRRDITSAMGGGYAQDHVLVSVVKIVRRISADEREIELEKPTIMSFRNGPTVPSDRYVIHSDGHVKFLDLENKPRDWNHHQPKWEHVHHPVLPVIVEGLEEEDVPAAKRTHRNQS